MKVMGMKESPADLDTHESNLGHNWARVVPGPRRCCWCRSSPGVGVRRQKEVGDAREEDRLEGVRQKMHGCGCGQSGAQYVLGWDWDTVGHPNRRGAKLSSPTPEGYPWKRGRWVRGRVRVAADQPGKGWKL